MARPRSYEEGRMQIQLRLSKELRNRLYAQADRRDLSMNYLVERALETVLPLWEAQDVETDLSAVATAKPIRKRRKTA